MCTYFCMRFIYSQSGIQGPCWGGWDCALLPGQMAPVTEGGGGEGAIKGKRGKKGGLEWPLNGAGVACPPEPPHLETTCRRISFTDSVFPDGGGGGAGGRAVFSQALCPFLCNFSVSTLRAEEKEVQEEWLGRKGRGKRLRFQNKCHFLTCLLLRFNLPVLSKE